HPAPHTPPTRRSSDLAHRAARGPPLEPGRAEDFVEPLLLGLGTDLLRAWDDHRAQRARHPPPIDHPRRVPQVADPRVRARADEQDRKSTRLNSSHRTI